MEERKEQKDEEGLKRYKKEGGGTEEGKRRKRKWGRTKKGRNHKSQKERKRKRLYSTECRRTSQYQPITAHGSFPI